MYADNSLSLNRPYQKWFIHFSLAPRYSTCWRDGVVSASFPLSLSHWSRSRLGRSIIGVAQWRRRADVMVTRAFRHTAAAAARCGGRRPRPAATGAAHAQPQRAGGPSARDYPPATGLTDHSCGHWQSRSIGHLPSSFWRKFAKNLIDAPICIISTYHRTGTEVLSVLWYLHNLRVYSVSKLLSQEWYW